MSIFNAHRTMSPLFSNLLEAMHQSRSAITIRLIGQAMETDNKRLTIEAADLRKALIGKMPEWLAEANGSADYTFLANAIAGVADLTVILRQETLIADTKREFGSWKARLDQNTNNEEAKTLHGKIVYLETCILNAKPPRRPKWEMMTK